jgi:hypothetical protein
VTDPEQPRWWTIRPVHSQKPATYRCPFCEERLHAMSDHVLIAPEGDGERRRHAHRECVVAARAAGRLPLEDEWRAGQPRRPSLLRRLMRRA